MNESQKRTTQSGKKGEKISHGNKLKNEASAGASMRRKFRHGKKNNSLTKEETAREKKLQNQGRKKAFAQTVSIGAVRREIVRNEDENVGTQSMESVLGTSETILYETKKNHYSKKMHEKKRQEEYAREDGTKHSGSHSSSRNAQKKRIKKEYEAAVRKKQAEKTADKVGNISQKVVDKTEEIAGTIAKTVAEHPMECLIAVAVLIVVLIVAGSLSSCSAITGGLGNMTLTTSYTAEDDQILAVDADYVQMETNLQTTIDNIETSNPGYDEYRYSLANIAHNPYQLAALLTVLYEDYTQAEVKTMLQTIFNAQYTLVKKEIVEIRTRTETKVGYRLVHNEDGTTSMERYTYEEEVEYEYRILQTTLTNNTLDAVVEGMGLTEDQKQRYKVLLETYGNKDYLFGDDIYSKVEAGDYTDYEIPPDALTDQRFANMIKEAEKYLGYPYVWGGASPSTSFDCSGFVSYVINQCGNGWSIGRQTADGLLGKCARISSSEAKPGDLIFFQGTYNTSGASHVGIYVGNGMMIHCGNPIQYASINSNYWKSHFYTFGRIK